jgi:tetratricopeptide (TPR) repeat protein
MQQQSLLTKILRWAVYALAFMPLIIFSQYISPFHFGKVVVFRSVVEIMSALYLALVLRDRSYLPRRDKFFWIFLAFTAAYTLATLTSINIYQSFWGTLERMGGAYSFWHYFIFYVIAVSVLRTREEWLTFLKLTVFTGFLSALYGFGQRTDISFFVGSGGRERIFGTIGNAALFAGYEILNIFLALVLGFTAQKKRNRNLLLGAAAIMGMAALLTVVRGSIYGLGAGLIIFAGLYFFETNSQKAKKMFIALAGLAVVFVVFALLFKNSSFVQGSPYLRRVTDFSVSSTTVQTRVWAWQAGLKGWSENPKKILVGWGPENFNIPFSKYFNPKFFDGPGSETLFDRAHNMFVEILVTTGLAGFLAYLAMFAVILRSLWQLKKKPEYRIPAIGFISMIVAYVIHNSFIFDTSANFLVFFTVLGYISYLTYEASGERTVEEKTAKATTGSTALAFVLVLAALFVVYQTNIKTTTANYATTRGIVAGWNNDFNSAVASYEKALSYDVAGRYEYRNRYAQFLLDYSSGNDTAPVNVQAAFKEAIAYEEKNAAENPNDYLPELYLSRLNIILGKSDANSPYNDIALMHSMKALSYSETFVRTYYEVGQGYLNKNNLPKAVEYFQKAVDLNPAVGISYWYLGSVEMQAGKTDKALADMDIAMKKGYVLTENDYLSLASTYIKKNDFAHLVTIYEGLVQLQPSNAQYMASLAVAYSRVGRIDDAVVAAHKAAQIDPNFTTEARNFVQQLGRQW